MNIIKITVDVGGKNYTFRPKEMLGIKGKHIAKELFTHSNTLFFWARLRDKANALYRAELDELYRMKSQSMVNVMEHLESKHSFCDSKIATAHVEVDPDVINQKKYVNDLHADKDVLESIVTAIKERGRVLVALRYSERFPEQINTQNDEKD